VRSIHAFLIPPWPLRGMLASAALVLAACGGGETAVIRPPVPIDSTVPRIEPYDLVPVGTRSASPASKAAPAPSGDTPRVRLPALSAAEWAGVAVDQAFPGGKPRARQIGLHRPVPALASSDDLQALLRWQAGPDGGQVAALRVGSEGAAALSLGLQVAALPPAALLRVFPAAGGEVLEFTGAELLAAGGALQKGDPSIWWAPTLSGDETVLELILPAGSAASEVRLGLPLLSHLWLDPASPKSSLQVKASGACNVDATCVEGTADDARSVALITFQDGGTWQCTATLMGNAAGTATRYLLTANHCVSRPEVAATVRTYWFYRSTACDRRFGERIEPGGTNGTRLLLSRTETDVSFLEMVDPPPVGVRFAGSLLVAPPVDAQVSGLHHPGGDPLKYSLGQVYGFKNCTGDARTNQVTCPAGDRFIEVRWSRGTTEQGSSGSALFGALQGVPDRRYVTGQLYAGRASCVDYERSSTTTEDYYGRFDISYRLWLYEWLGSVPGAGCDTC
jgi:lysyl endopeptidase